MSNMTYLAILEPGEDGSYGISFPDLPGCFSYGENLTRSLVPCPTSSPHARIPKKPGALAVPGTPGLLETIPYYRSARTGLFRKSS